MVRNCFYSSCKSNKWRSSSGHNVKLPASFRFPKSASLLEEWKKVIPPHSYRREPTRKDFLCSLHFKMEDVIKYYEIKGCPKDEVVRIERGIWILDSGAIPHYFSDENPDAESLVRNVQRRASLASKRNNQGETDKTENYDSNECPKDEQGEMGNPKEDFDEFEIPTEKECNKLEKDPKQVISQKFDKNASLDHTYHVPLKPCTVRLERCTVNSVSNSTFPLELCLKEPTPLSTGNSNVPTVTLEHTSRNSCPKPPSKLKYAPYTIEQLHQDVLEIVLPKNWTFFQNEDDNRTEFIFFAKDMSVKSIRFLGSCHPRITVGDSVVEHHRVNSRQDIEELLELISIL